jgi:two-component system sensor histidine kinase ResE
MPIRYKFLASFFVFIVVPLTLAGMLTFFAARRVVVARVTAQLTSLAQVQEKRVLEMLDRYIEQVKLVTSRTQLRRSISLYEQSGDISEVARVRSILSDALHSTQSIQEITLYDRRGSLITSVSSAEAREEFVSRGRSFDTTLGSAHRLSRIFKDENNLLRVELVGPLVLEHDTIGYIEMVMSAAPVVAITEDHSGLGETGEVLLAAKNKAGDALFLTPLRSDAGAALTRGIPQTDVTNPTVIAIAGSEVVLTDARDYRGKRVFAVTRYIEPLEWGLVTKIDSDEALAPLLALVRAYVVANAAVSLVAIAAAFFIAHGISSPIAQLERIAEKMQKGDFSERVNLRRRDELGVLGTAINDMSEELAASYHRLQESEEKYRLIAESSGEGIFLLDRNGLFVFVNTVFAMLFGYEKQALLGVPFSTLLWGKDVREGEQQLEKLRGGEPLRGEVEARRRDGTPLTVAFTATPIRNTRGVGVATGIVRDVTEERLLERAKEDFLIVASHDMRAPLVAIQGNLELLTTFYTSVIKNSEVQEILEDSHVASQRMLRLVNSFLSAAQLEMGRLHFKKERFDVVPVIQELLHELEPSFSEKGLQFSFEPHGQPVFLMVDREKMKQVIVNLLDNAIKHTDKGVVTISLDPRDGFADILVRDTGEGIPPAERARLFEKFQIGGDVLSRGSHGGTGLGLYIARLLVEGMSGEIALEKSEVGKGSVFRVSLPVVKDGA